MTAAVIAASAAAPFWLGVSSTIAPSVRPAWDTMQRLVCGAARLTSSHPARMQPAETARLTPAE